MATAPSGGAAKTQQEGKWWCNFCGLRTDDQEQYLSHSCQDELKRRGVEPPQNPGDHCR